jgi:lysozyme family protein
MANFDLAFEKTMGAEGGYTKNPTDVGGETYKGVSRKYEPNWEGWAIIESLKNKPNFPKNLDSNDDLQALVKRVYKEKYWNVNKLDLISDQAVAEEMFDTGVNMGTKRAAIYLQTALNCLNKNQVLYGDIAEDGKIGTETLYVLKALLSKESNETLLKIMNVLQGMHYIEYMKSDPAQETFTRGWFTRVTISKTY